MTVCRFLYPQKLAEVAYRLFNNKNQSFITISNCNLYGVPGYALCNELNYSKLISTYWTEKPYNTETAGQILAEREKYKLLLKKLNYKKYNKELAECVHNGNTEMVRLLLEKGANPNYTYTQTNTHLVNGCFISRL